MWNGPDANGYGSSNAPEPPNRQKAMVLRALVADLSFWGDLNSVVSCKQDNAAQPAKAEATTVRMPMDQPLHSSETRTMATATASSNLNAASATTTTASINTNNNSSIPIWKTAVDAHTGKTYYYDIVSRRTQWEKVSC